MVFLFSPTDAKNIKFVNFPNHYFSHLKNIMQNYKTFTICFKWQRVVGKLFNPTEKVLQRKSNWITASIKFVCDRSTNNQMNMFHTSVAIV